MQLISGRTARFALLTFLVGAVISSPVAACTLTVTLPNGELELTADGSQLTSDPLLGGRSVTMTVLAVGLGNTLTVQAPSITQVPSGFNQSGLTAEVAYRGTATGRVIQQNFVNQTTQVSITPIIGLVTMTINNRIRHNGGGFASGDYKTMTVVTCS